jgi:protein TonB
LYNTQKLNTMKKEDVKKSPKANLEPEKSTYFLMGLVLAVALILMAMEWSTELRKLDERKLVYITAVDEDIPPTQRPPTPPPPPPPPPPPVVPESFNVVDQPVDTPIDLGTEPAPIVDVLPPTLLPNFQKSPAVEADEEIFVVVEKMPEFLGGVDAMMRWLGSNIRYPDAAAGNGIHGRVVCSFVIERDGSITDVQVMRGVDPALDREAVRVIRAMPNWTPGMQRNTPVRVRFTLPVTFRLHN